LLELGCHVIMVFDGRPLPAKKNTNEERRQRRFDNVKAGELLLSEGKINEALGKFKRATSITSDIVESTISYFRNHAKVDVIVSPYESDAQLTFLVKEGFADIVITEDSDLIVFGCEKIAFKWNCESGDCMIYEKSQLPQCFSGTMRTQFDFTKFRRICILSGCDYLQLLPRIPSYLNMPKLRVTKEFIDDFIRAENTFIYQVVFDPRQRCQRPLTKYLCCQKDSYLENNENDFASDEQFLSKDYSYAGEVISSKLAVRLALGNQVWNTLKIQLSDMFTCFDNRSIHIELLKVESV
uniref:Exonuclease 1 n=1 Tax=Angiostrongylus cantonensis TaxID=6313 RepID=A0A0K0DJZ8_ANGCA